MILVLKIHFITQEHEGQLFHKLHISSTLIKHFDWVEKSVSWKKKSNHVEVEVRGLQSPKKTSSEL